MDIMAAFLGAVVALGGMYFGKWAEYRFRSKTEDKQLKLVKLERKRTQLEELVATAYGLDDYMDRIKAEALGTGLKIEEPDPTSKLKMMTRLFFPELMEEIINITNAVHSYNISNRNMEIALLNRKGGNITQEELDTAKTEYLAEIQQHQREYLQRLDEFTDKAYSIIESLDKS